jgi:itaconate CoA-transferase
MDLRHGSTDAQSGAARSAVTAPLDRDARWRMKALNGLLVVSLDQAVAAPMTARRLADAGARVIKLERPEGDFAREYDKAVRGQCTHFLWLNRGKESVVVDLRKADDRRLFEALLGKADVFLQNLKPGALAKLGYGIEILRQRHPGLICCSISGYGEQGPFRERKAYDLLVQAESGLASLTGGPEAPARVGVSLVDIGTGLHAYEAILEALIQRSATGQGADIRVSMFDAMMEWMTVPLLFAEYAEPPRRSGLSHPSLAPYGVFKTADGVPILISIQNDREWVGLCRKVLGRPELGSDPRFATSPARLAHRAETDAAVARCFGSLDVDSLSQKLEAAEIAFARVNAVTDVLKHPHLRRLSVDTPFGPVMLPAPAAQASGAETDFGAIPTLGAHTEAVRREFLGGSAT